MHLNPAWECSICGKLANYSDCGTKYCGKHWWEKLNEEDKKKEKEGET